MKRDSTIVKDILKLCKAYVRWVNGVADNYKISENKLNKMVRKGSFKHREDAEKSTKRLIKISLFGAPFFFLAISMSLISNLGNQTVVENSEILSVPVALPESPSPENNKTFESLLLANVSSGGKDFHQYVKTDRAKRMSSEFCERLSGGQTTELNPENERMANYGRMQFAAEPIESELSSIYMEEVPSSQRIGFGGLASYQESVRKYKLSLIVAATRFDCPDLKPIVSNAYGWDSLNTLSWE